MSFLESIKKEEKKNKSWLKKISFYLFILASVTIPLFYLPVVQDVVNTPKLYLLYGFGLVTLFLFLLDVLVSKELVMRTTFLTTPLLIFIGIAIISSIFSLIPSISLMGKTDIFVMSLSSLVILVLWFWLLIQLVSTTKEWQYIIDGLLISASIAGLIFLFQNASIVQLIIPSDLVNVISNSNSAFGVFMATMATLGLGFLQIKDRPWALQILPLITALISIISLVRLGFQTPLIIFATGLGLLLMIGVVMLQSSRIPVISTTFALFVGTILIIFLGVPDFATANLSSEVSINAGTSWDITTDTVLKDIKTFLVGSGPGTFVQDFSKFRPQSFNMNSVAWTARFERPYNTLFAIISEMGILGLLSFIGLLFLALGGIFSGWLKTRPSVWDKAKEKVKQPEQSMKSFRLEAFVVIIAWFCLTVGMFLSFYGVTLWWMWFTFLGLSIVGLASLVPSFVTEKRMSLEVSPRHSLLLSFGMIVLVTIMILIGGYGTQVLLADVAFTKSLQAKELDKKAEYIDEALSYRNSYIPYKVAKARYFLNKARQANQKSDSNNEQVAQYIAKAVNITKKATDSQPNSVKTWETLADMYLNSQRLVPEANKWAKKSLKKAIELEPTNPELHRKLGSVHAFAGETKKAKESYRKAIQLKPNYVIAYTQLSKLLSDEGKYSEAIALYQPIFNVVKESPQAMFNLGRLFYNRAQEGDLDRAERILKRATKLDRNYANALYALALVHQKKGETKKAENYFKKVQEITPEDINLQQRQQQVENPKTPPQ